MRRYTTKDVVLAIGVGYQTLLLLSVVAVAQSQPNLQTTIDFMNQMSEPDGRQLRLMPDSKCEVVIVSWHRVEQWLLLSSENRFMVGNDSDVDADHGEITFPRYTKFNLADVDPATIQSKTGGFSSGYVKRFFDEHADVCKVVGDECKHQQMLAFDMKRSDMTTVGFKTRDLKPAIERGGTKKIERSAGTEYQYNPNVSVEKMGMFFSNEDKAQRFVTALIHAVELCGGHGSMFAPTPEIK